MTTAQATWTDQRDVNIPMRSEERGLLTLAGGVSHLTLRGDATLADLCRAHFEGVIPEVGAQEGQVTVTYPRFWPFGWLRTAFPGGRTAADLTLTARVPWEITLRGGASHFDADLSTLDLRAFVIRGGASHIALALARPTATTSLRIRGGASEIEIRRPAGVPVRLAIHGGASRLSFDEMRFGAIGGGFEWQSPDYREAAGRIELTITGGASRISVTEVPEA